MMSNQHLTKPMSLSHVACPVSSGEFGARVFNGEILVFRQLPPVRGICREMRKVMRAALSPIDPISVHVNLTEAEYFQRIHDLQQSIRANRRLYELFSAALELIGFDVSEAYWDRFILRVVPPIASHHGGYASHVMPHRDTWGVNIHQQVNWWAPVFPIAANRTIRFYPCHWRSPIPNTTDSWRFESYLAAMRKSAAGHRPPYPAVPQCLASPRGPVFHPVIKPGDMLAFSAAHLHGSVPNRSKFTRVSFEIRTVHAEHLRCGLAAPNIDNAAKTGLTRIYTNVVSGDKLPASAA
jgi:hypothetical protein